MSVDIGDSLRVLREFRNKPLTIETDFDRLAKAWQDTSHFTEGLQGSGARTVWERVIAPRGVLYTVLDSILAYEGVGLLEAALNPGPALI